MQSQNTTFRGAERQEESRPLYLYIFKHTPFFGAATFYYLTNYDADVSVTGLPIAVGADPQVFTSGNVSHSEIEQTVEQNAPRSDISIGLNDSDVASDLRGYFLTAKPSRIEVWIIRANKAAAPTSIAYGTDTFTVFRGLKQAITIRGSTVVLSCVNLMLQDDGQVPRWNYQRLCHHTLGEGFVRNLGPGSCRVDLENARYSIATTIVAVNRANRTVQISQTTLNAIAISTSTFVGGKLAILVGGDPTDIITIMSCEILPASGGTVLRLAWWNSALAAALTIKAYRGCLKIVDDCKTFQNSDDESAVVDFGATPFIPVSNPSLDGIVT